MARYPTLKGAKLPTQATKLAKEAVFGEKIMKQCTPLGSCSLPGLPTAEVNELKVIHHNSGETQPNLRLCGQIASRQLDKPVRDYANKLRSHMRNILHVTIPHLFTIQIMYIMHFTLCVFLCMDYYNHSTNTKFNFSEVDALHDT